MQLTPSRSGRLHHVWKAIDKALTVRHTLTISFCCYVYFAIINSSCFLPPLQRSRYKSCGDETRVISWPCGHLVSHVSRGWTWRKAPLEWPLDCACCGLFSDSNGQLHVMESLNLRNFNRATYIEGTYTIWDADLSFNVYMNIERTCMCWKLAGGNSLHSRAWQVGRRSKNSKAITLNGWTSDSSDRHHALPPHDADDLDIVDDDGGEPDDGDGIEEVTEIRERNGTNIRIRK